MLSTSFSWLGNQLRRAAEDSEQTSESYASPVRFVIVGLSNAVLSYSTFFILIGLLGRGESASFVAQSIGFAAGVIWSFFWNGRWTFRRLDFPLERLTRFLLLQLVLLLVSASAIAVVIGHFGVGPFLGWFAVMVPITVANFFGSRELVFCSLGRAEH